MTNVYQSGRATASWRSPSRAERPSGFTLLEAVVAMAIIGVISVAALGAFSADLRAADRAQRTLPAAALAEERLASLETRGWGVLALSDSLARGRFDSPWEAYSWTVTMNRIRNIPNLVELSVSVSWQEGSFTLAERRYAP